MRRSISKQSGESLESVDYDNALVVVVSSKFVLRSFVNVNLAHGAYDRLAVYMYVNAFIVVVVVVVVVSPHRMQSAKIWPIVTYVPQSVCLCVCQSVLRSRELC